MNKTTEELYEIMEKKLNERDAKILRHNELIKDINDFEALLPELYQAVKEVEEKNNASEDNSFQNELNSWLKERQDYWDLINSFRNEEAQLQEELQKEQELINAFYKRREIIVSLRNIENIGIPDGTFLETVLNEYGFPVSIPGIKKDFYQAQMEELDRLDSSLLQQLAELDNSQKAVYMNFERSEEDPYHLDLPSFEPLVNFKTDENEEELQVKLQQLYDEMHEIENGKGKKQTLTYSLHDKDVRVNIPKKLVGKYQRLLFEVKTIEEELENIYPPVVFEGDLYETMTEPQKKSYLANLMLQIEARCDMALNKCYIKGKYVPLEYKELYDKIAILLNQHSKNVQLFSVPIDWIAVESFSVEERRNYFKDLMQKYLANATQDVQEVQLDDAKYLVSLPDVPAFRTCYEEYQKASKELEVNDDLMHLEENLNQKEKENYYIKKIEMICSREVHNPFIYTVNGKQYTLDEAYKEEFLEIIAHYADAVNPENAIVVEKKRKPKFLESFKKKLKRVAVAAVLLVASTALMGFAKYMPKTSKNLNVVESVSEDAKENESFDFANLDENILNTSFEETDLDENLSTDFQINDVNLKDFYQDWTDATNFKIEPGETAFIYQSGSDVPLSPKYPNDEYRIVNRKYEMPDGTSLTVNMEEKDAATKVYTIDSEGGILRSVDAVAQTGEEDYAIHRIPTGTFMVDENLSPFQETIELENSNQGRGR